MKRTYLVQYQAKPCDYGAISRFNLFAKYYDEKWEAIGAAIALIGNPLILSVTVSTNDNWVVATFSECMRD